MARGIRNNRRGIGLIYSVLVLLVLCAMASFAVDMGRVVLAKNQLRSAADASALAAANLVLSNQTAARSAAVATAKSNNVDGSPCILDANGDITFIHWDEKTHSEQPVSASAKVNAVKVTAHRTAARGNPIDLPFAKIVGANTCDIHATAIALATPTRYAIVGLDFITMGGNATNAYRSSANANNGQFMSQGDIASNGNITLSGSTLVDGNAYAGVGKQVIGSNHVTGTSTSLTSPLVYPPADVADVINNNNNASLPLAIMSSGAIKMSSQKNGTLPSGTYYVTGLDMGAGSELNCTGPVTIYVAGNVSLGGHAITRDNIPHNLQIIVVGNGTTVSLSGGSDLYADVYAPQSAITMSGNGDIFGAIVGKSVSMTGTSAVHYDLSLRGGVSLVK